MKKWQQFSTKKIYECPFACLKMKISSLKDPQRWTQWLCLVAWPTSLICCWRDKLLNTSNAQINIILHYKHTRIVGHTINHLISKSILFLNRWTFKGSTSSIWFDKAIDLNSFFHLIKNALIKKPMDDVRHRHHISVFFFCIFLWNNAK